MSVASTAPNTDSRSCTVGTVSSEEVLVPVDAPESVTYDFKTVAGDCPLEGSTWICDANCDEDCRLLLPLTLRYICDVGVAMPYAQRLTVRQAIWETVTQEMRAKGWRLSLPSIIFDDDPLDATKQHGCVHVVFSNTQLWSHMFSRMRKIRIERAEGAPIVYSYHRSSSDLPGNILPIDLLRLPLTSTDAELILKSLNVMAASTGTTTGLATFTHRTTNSSLSHGVEGARAYIKLNDSSMTIPFHLLVSKPPTHFVWHGVPITMYYPGRSLHKNPLHSANFPAELEKLNLGVDHGGTSSSSSSTSASTSQFTSNGAPQAQGSKRKRS